MDERDEEARRESAGEDLRRLFRPRRRMLTAAQHRAIVDGPVERP